MWIKIQQTNIKLKKFKIREIKQFNIKKKFNMLLMNKFMWIKIFKTQMSNIKLRLMRKFSKNPNIIKMILRKKLSKIKIKQFKNKNKFTLQKNKINQALKVYISKNK